jgi:hypothetical protein
MAAGACATASAWASTNAMSRSRNGPSADGIPGGGIRLLNAAASKSSPLGKWRYKVALATFALRVTASTVTALGPPARSNAAAASSKRARDRAGRGSVIPPVMVSHLSVSKRDYRSTYKTIGLESPYAAEGERLMVETLVRPDQIGAAVVLAVAVAAIVEAPDRGRSDLLNWGGLVAGGIIAVVFGVVEFRKSHPRAAHDGLLPLMTAIAFGPFICRWAFSRRCRFGMYRSWACGWCYSRARC